MSEHPTSSASGDSSSSAPSGGAPASASSSSASGSAAAAAAPTKGRTTSKRKANNAVETQESTHRTRLRTGREAAAAAESARWLALSPAQRCFSDGLALAFSHLTLVELVTAARCCKSWYEGAKRVKRLGAGQDSLLDVSRRIYRERTSPSLPGARLLGLSASPFRHLICKLQSSWKRGDIDLDRSSAHEKLIAHPSLWRLADLLQLQHLPHVKEISCMLIRLQGFATLLEYPSHIRRLLFPRQLESVHLSISFMTRAEAQEEDWEQDWEAAWDLAHSACEIALESLGACTSLTEVKLTALEEVAWDLAPLLQIKQLRRLMLFTPYQHYGEEEIDVIKQISTLQVAPHTSLDFSIQHLQSLQQMRSLTLTRMHPPLDEATIASLQPPSALMPSLKAFKYTARIEKLQST